MNFGDLFIMFVYAVDYFSVQTYNKRIKAGNTNDVFCIIPEWDMDKFFKRTWAEINLDAICHNYHEVKKTLNPSTKICCVVKADGYGHGASFVAKELEGIGAQWFAVSNLEEAIQLRRSGIHGNMLILGYTPPQEAARLHQLNISQTVFSYEYGKELAEYATAAGIQVKIHIKVDTGMSRIGFLYQIPKRDMSVIDEIDQVCHMPGLYPEGIFTHFSVSDEGESGDCFTENQFQDFMGAIDMLKRRGIQFQLRHCSNSGAILDHPDMQMDMVRPGIILYGLLPSRCIRKELNFIPAMELKTIISMMKTVEENTSVSYGRCFVTQRKTRLATVPIGYADGYPRLLHNHADMLVCGKRARIVGRVCMDQLILDVTDIPQAQTGITVTIFGKDAEETITVDELASYNSTIHYEMVCLVGKRVPRIYLQNGEQVGQLNYICPESF